MARISPKHLLNTSWTINRLSPLHHNEFQSLIDNPVALDTYAARLRDHLTNALTEVQGFTEETNLSGIGALKTCVWETISTLCFLDTTSLSSEQNQSGILVTLTYENNTTYKAALLAPLSSSDNNNNKKGPTKTKVTRASKQESTYFPLLLTRLPKSLRETFVSFLSSSFDTFCSPLRLSSQFLCVALQTYVGGLNPQSGFEFPIGKNLVEDVIKEMQLTLSFCPPIYPALKTINVNIPRGSFTSFVSIPTSPPVDVNGPGDCLKVLTGLSEYLRKHLALELGLEAIDLSLAGQYMRLTRITCSAFVATSEGRLKLVVKGAGTGEDVDGEEEQNDRTLSALRASEVLLRAIVQRAVIEGLS